MVFAVAPPAFILLVAPATTAVSPPAAAPAPASRLKALEIVPAGAALLAPEGMQELPLKPAAHFSHFTPAKFTLHEH